MTPTPKQPPPEFPDHLWNRDHFTLQKILQAAGFSDRRSIRRAITSGRVTINGRITTDPHAPIDPERDIITVMGKRIKLAVEKKVYYILNKPRDVISSLSDPQGRKTILDFFEGVVERIYPVGRLDFLSEGLMLLTNDGDLTNHVISPRNRIPKVYQVKLEGLLAPEKIKKLVSRGLVVEGRRVKPQDVVLLKHLKNSHSLVRITLYEGKKHIVRKIFANLDHPVRELKRVSIGSLRLKGLPSGQWRKLSETEVSRFKRNCGFERDSAATADG